MTIKNPVGRFAKNGVLSIELVREVPEAMKPRAVKIGGGGAKVIENKAA